MAVTQEEVGRWLCSGHSEHVIITVKQNRKDPEDCEYFIIRYNRLHMVHIPDIYYRWAKDPEISLTEEEAKTGLIQAAAKILERGLRNRKDRC